MLGPASNLPSAEGGLEAPQGLWLAQWDQFHILFLLHPQPGPCRSPEKIARSCTVTVALSPSQPRSTVWATPGNRWRAWIGKRASVRVADGEPEALRFHLTGEVIPVFAEIDVRLQRSRAASGSCDPDPDLAGAVPANRSAPG